ncbi:MAG: response regulator [Actinomycetota bacterium]
MPDVLLATDADWIHDEVEAAIADDDTAVTRVGAGRDVVPAVRATSPDLVVLDLQIGNMGGMATCMSLRLEEGAGRLERTPVLMLLDRTQDTFLARRSDADGWLIKPLDAFRLRRAAQALLSGERWVEGVADDGGVDVEPMIPVTADGVEEGTAADEPADPADPEAVAAD